MEKETNQIIVIHRPVETAMRNKTWPLYDVRKAMAARVMMSARKEKFIAVVAEIRLAWRSQSRGELTYLEIKPCSPLASVGVSRSLFREQAAEDVLP